MIPGDRLSKDPGIREDWLVDKHLYGYYQGSPRISEADLQILGRGAESAHGQVSDVRQEFELSVTWLYLPEKLVFGLWGWAITPEFPS